MLKFKKKIVCQNSFKILENFLALIEIYILYIYLKYF